MARRKSVCVKWTLVLLVVVVCPFVYSRPQDTQVISSTTNSVQNDKATETPIRYRYRQIRFNLDRFKTPIAIGFSKNTNNNTESNYLSIKNGNYTLNSPASLIPYESYKYNSSTRTNRMLTKTVIQESRNSVRKKPNKIVSNDNVKHELLISSSRKPAIRKVITKWTDKTKYEDLNFSDDTSTSTEKQDSIAFTNSLNLDVDSSSTENIIIDDSKPVEKRRRPYYPNKFYDKIDSDKNYRPIELETEDDVGIVHSNKVHIIEYPFPSVRPAYVFTTPRPTPIITNVGNPKPWPPQQTIKQKPTQMPVRPKPLKNQQSYHNNNYPHYPDDNFEVTTFQPANAYTERIVIRPEEYAATNDDCPTIFLTLNNTFQGQGKEACPDLNIAVNTNVVNKNVVVESEEDDGDGLFPGGFDLPLGEDSDGEEAAQENDYFDSEEDKDEGESASVEVTGLSNYNAALQADSSDSAAGGAGDHAGLTAQSKPFRRPHKNKNKDEDSFTLSGVVSFFKPAIDAMTWLAAINPFSFSIISMLMTPLVMLIAGYSGVAALFAPLGLAREATPKIIHVYRPQWEWDEKYKTWYLHSFPDNRRWKPKNGRMPRNSQEVDDEAQVGEPVPVKTEEIKKLEGTSTTAPVTPNAPRNTKNKTPVIGESIKMVANQLLEAPSNTSVETAVVIDTRIPPKLKNQIHKHKIKTRNEDSDEPLDNSHPGEAIPVTMDELESENKISESSTSNEGISTWILLSNPTNKDNSTSTEATKTEEPQKKKTNPPKNKTKKPSNNKVSVGKRPIIGSTNKSDLVAGGSAINENVFNKIKDTVLSNVQKNKNQSLQKTTTSANIITTTTTVSPSTEALTTKKEVITKPPVTVPVKVSKPSKKKNKNKQKVRTTTLAPVINESALLPMEPKEQEIELEISTPATTTKKPKRTSTKKKNKTKKRKTTKPKPETTTVSEVKHANKTKTTKTKTKKPDITSLTGPITSQIYSYFSREVMPSVGVGVLGLASLVGLAGYFLYPFSTPVRRTFEVDKKDDIYRHNAEEYASEGNGQAEEEMLGTVLAGMPAHSKQKLNPYAGQTAHVNRYPVKKEQDIRYRHVAAGYEPNYNVRYPQQKTGIAHGAVYSEPYNPQQYETRHVYSSETKYTYDKGQSGYTSAAVEPIYAAPQTAPQSAPSAISAYGSDSSNSVVYGVKPSSDSEFKPVYPFDSQFYSETTSSPVTYPPTSMYLGSNNEDEQEEKYSEEVEPETDTDNKFVVGNVPKELSESATPAVVPEHGPRNLRRRRTLRQKRSITSRIEELLNAAKDENKDIFISNEIDEALGLPVKHLAATDDSPMKNDVTGIPEIKDVVSVYAVSMDPAKEEKTTDAASTVKTEIVESVSTIPIDNKDEKSTTDTSNLNDVETTTKTFRVYEVFSTINPNEVSEQNVNTKVETTTVYKNLNTETTTEFKSETTSTMPPSPSPVTDFSTASQTVTTNNPEVLTYPPLNQEGGFFTFLKRLIEFKYRLGLSILQTTSENLNRYLRSMENKAEKVAKPSRS